RDEVATFQLTEMHPIPSRAGSTSQGYRIAEDQSAGMRAFHNLIPHAPGRPPEVSPTRFSQCPLRSESDRSAALPQSVPMCPTPEVALLIELPSPHARLTGQR